MRTLSFTGFRALSWAVPARRSGAARGRLGGLGWLGRAALVQRERRALRRLDAARLADIGVSRGAAWDEGNRPFWDLP